jgi:hypothetical protein
MQNPKASDFAPPPWSVRVAGLPFSSMNQPSAVALLLFCLCGLLGGVPSASAKPVIPKEGPPVLVPLDLKLEGRVPMRITLKAKGVQRFPVKFLLRGEPEFGQVRLLKQLSRDSAEVEYVPPADRSIKADSFRFAGSSEQGFASDCVVRIQIVNEGPRLVVAKSLDFAETRVGKSTRGSLEIRNAGDETGSGQITVPAPWELEQGADRYSLAPGEQKAIGVWFKPTKAGWGLGELRMVREGSQLGEQTVAETVERTVELRARALDWVEVAHDPIVFEWSDSHTQQASLVLLNPDKEPLDLTLGAKPALEHEPKVTLESGATLTIPLRWRGDLVPNGWGTLLLTSNSGMQRVVVWHLDAILSGFGADFVLSGDAGSASLSRTFTNTGGRSGSWKFRCTPPFYVGDAAHLPKVAPVVVPSQSRSLHPPEAPATRTAIPGFVWDHNLNRYVPSGGGAKAAAPPKSEQAPGLVWDHNLNRLVPGRIGGSPAPVPKSESKDTPPPVPQSSGPTELTRRLQPGESFVLFVGLSGIQPTAPGTLSVSGSGENRQVPLFLKGGRGAKPGPTGLSPEVPSVATPSGVTAAPAATEAPSSKTSPSPQSVETRGTEALPNILPSEKSAPKSLERVPPLELQNLIFPGLALKGFRVKEVTSDSATISFPAGPGVTPEHLVVRYRELRPVEGGDLKAEWLPFEGANRRGKRVGSNIEIRLRGLVPGWVNHIDLIGPLLANGKRMKLHEEPIYTLPAPSVFSPKRPWLWTALVPTLGAAYFLRRRFQ